MFIGLQSYKITIQLHLKKFKVYEVMDFTFNRKNLHLVEDYIYYNLQLRLLWIYEVTIIIDLYLKPFRSLLFYIIKDRFYEDIFIYCIYLSIYLFIYLFI